MFHSTSLFWYIILYPWYIIPYQHLTAVFLFWFVWVCNILIIPFRLQNYIFSINRPKDVATFLFLQSQVVKKRLYLIRYPHGQHFIHQRTHRATASNINTFMHLCIARMHYCSFYHKVASPGTRTSSSAGSLSQTEWICCAYGDVKRKAGAHCALSAVATRSPVGWIELLIVPRR